MQPPYDEPQMKSFKGSLGLDCTVRRIPLKFLKVETKGLILKTVNHQKTNLPERDVCASTTNREFTRGVIITGKLSHLRRRCVQPVPGDVTRPSPRVTKTCHFLKIVTRSLSSHLPASPSRHPIPIPIPVPVLRIKASRLAHVTL